MFAAGDVSRVRATGSLKWRCISFRISMFPVIPARVNGITGKRLILDIKIKQFMKYWI